MLTKDSFGDELSALLKRIPGEPKYGVFAPPRDAAGEQSDDEEEEEYDESDEEVPDEVWNDDIDDAAHPNSEDDATGGEEEAVTVIEADATDGEESAGEGNMTEETDDDDDDLRRQAINRRRRQLKLGSVKVARKSWMGEAYSVTSSSEADNDGSDFEISDESSDSYESHSSQPEGDVSDYEGMPADAKKRKIITFSPEDQRRIKFRR